MYAIAIFASQVVIPTDSIFDWQAKLLIFKSLLSNKYNRTMKGFKLVNGRGLAY